MRTIKYTASFERFSEFGNALFSVRDLNGIDPIGEFIFIDDCFFSENEVEFASGAPFNPNDVVLQLLSVPTLDDMNEVVGLVFRFNDADGLTDIDYFKECASLTIGEMGL